MDTLIITGFLLALASSTLCQHYAQQGGEQQDQYNYRPPPQILSHKQALNHDGNFKYVFTSENGLAQGESIAPDGSRNGGYSYTDPTGRKISVKYTAGKEGFRILEADHLPKAPQPIAPVPAPANYAPQAYSAGPQDDGQYRPELYERPSAPQYYNPAPAYTQQRPYVAPRAAAPITNGIQQREPEYHDEPGKPHSFGSGYVFEFAG